MYTELLQLAVVLIIFAGALFAWLKVVYLPRRTLEHWQGEKAPVRSETREASVEDQRGL